MTTSLRTRWSAIGAAVAVSLGAGGFGLARATSPSGAAAFVPITPCRVFDTRPAFNVGPKTSALGVGDVYTVAGTGTTGNCTIPASATGLVLNLTAVNPSQATFLTVWGDGTRPDASSLNPTPGQPPTPNAVTTDLTASGQFNVYNLAGNVHAFADVVGYYTDHTHDDRYYTKAQTDVQVAASKSISIDPNGVEVVGATVSEVGYGALGGIILPDGVFSDPYFVTGWTMPPDYTAGAAVTLRLTWAVGATGCTVALVADGGLHHIGLPSGGIPALPLQVDAVPTPMRTVAVATLAFPPSVTSLLAPGDALTVDVVRAQLLDTCGAPLNINGIEVLYS